MDALIQRISHPSWAIPIALSIVSLLYSRIKSASTLPSGLPWVGKDSSLLFADTRATFASFSNVRKWLGEGYEKACLLVNDVLCAEADACLSIPSMARPTFSPTSQENLKSLYLGTKFHGCSSSLTVSSVSQRFTTIPSKAHTISPILKSSRTHITSMSYTNTSHGGWVE